MLRIFWLCLLLGYQHPVAMRQFHLHVRNTRACRRPGRILDWQFCDSCQFPKPCEMALLRNKRILFVHMNATEESCRGGLEEYPTVARIAARLGPLNCRSLIAI